MTTPRASNLVIAIVVWILVFWAGLARAADLLPSWNEGATKARIVGFVQSVIDESGKDYVAPADRIAVFDNDGTLWSEQPTYFQLAFAIDRVKVLAPQYPEWKSRQPFKAALEGDMKALAASGERGLLELVMATHAGNTSDEFGESVRDWVKTARHPKFKRPYTALTFAPMRELLDYLRANGFKTYIVSGGGVEFLRVIAQELYGVPPEQVIGSSVRTKYDVRDGKPSIVRMPEIDFIDDKAGREFAYDRTSHVGKLDRGLDEAGKRGWLVVSMKNDWRTVYAPVR